MMHRRCGGLGHSQRTLLEIDFHRAWGAAADQVPVQTSQVTPTGMTISDHLLKVVPGGEPSEVGRRSLLPCYTLFLKSRDSSHPKGIRTVNTASKKFNR